MAGPAETGDERRTAETAAARGHRPVIAIDGPGGSGKSTVARRLAQCLGLLYLDTGALYRAVALAVLRAGLVGADGRLDEPAIAALVEGADLRLAQAGGEQRVWWNGTDVTSELRGAEVDALVAFVAALPAVRRALLPQQRRLAAAGGVVADGRDVGTAVLPDADHKFFLTAELGERARRRQRDLALRGEGAALAGVQESLARRDRIDESRTEAPLRPASGAIVVDTTRLSVDQVVELMLQACRAPAEAGRNGGRR